MSAPLDYVARKISSAKWHAKEGFSPAAIRADAVTGDLRTQGDELSVWRCAAGDHDTDDVFLALITAPAVTRFETLEIVLFSITSLNQLGLRLVHSPAAGHTAVGSLRDRHYDVEFLDLEGISRIARAIALEVRTASTLHRRKTAGQMKELVRRTVHEGQITSDQLNERLRREIGL